MKSSIGPQKSNCSTRNKKRRRLIERRPLQTECLENRVLLAGDTMAWHNADLPQDANSDGRVTALDALVVINDLNASGARDVDTSVTPIGLVDITGDGVVSAADPLSIINRLNSGEGEGEIVRFRLVATEVNSEEPVTTLGLNEDFMLRAFVTDLSETGQGMFSAYMDVTYTAGLADVVGNAIMHDPQYPNGQSGDISVDGIMDEVGSFANSFVGQGSAEVLLFSIPMTTEGALGTLVFSPDPADESPAHDVTIFGENDPIATDEIEFVGTSVQVVSGDITTAIADEFDATEDETLIVSAENGVLSNDTNPGGANLTAVIVSQPANGFLSLNADGSFSYIPNADFFGQDSFSYAANNGAVNSNVAEVTLLVGSVNDAPVGVADSYTTTLNTTLLQLGEEGVLTNDSDLESTALTATIVRQANNGVTSLQSDGSFAYVPNIGFTGTDSFEYVASDGEDISERVTVTIEVGSGANVAPETTADSYTVAEGGSLTIAVGDGLLANDSDPNGDTITARIVGNATNGNAIVLPDGSFQYTPNAGFTGNDSFTYVANDGLLDSAATTVSITIGEQELTSPIGIADAYIVQQDSVLVVSAVDGILANDSDPSGDAISVELPVLVPTSNGTLEVQSDGSFEYTPNAGFSGDDRFGYTVIDSTGLESFATLVTITVTPVTVNNTPPTVSDETYEVDFETVLLTPAVNGVLANDVDADGDTLTVTPLILPANGFLSLNPNGAFSYIPNTGFSGVDSFTYAVSDGTDQRSGQATLNVGDAPVPTDGSVQIRLEATDDQGNVLTSIESGESFQLNAYVDDTDAAPILGVFAAYMDVEWNSSLAEVVGDIAYADAYPNGRIGDTTSPGTIDEVGAFAGNSPLGADEQLLFTVPMLATGGGDLVFTTNAADNLPFGDVLLFDTELGQERVPVGEVVFGSAELTVIGISRPIAVDDNYESNTTLLSVSAADGVLSNDRTVGDATLVTMLGETTQNGVLQLNGDGSFTYEANPGFIGTDSFTYRAVTVGSASELATVTIQVGDLTRSSIAGSVYFDIDNSASRNSNEHGFGGLAVSLTGTDLLGQSVSQSTTTDANGSYSFVNLLSGSYVVSQEQPAVVIDGIDSIGGVASATNNSHAFELDAATNLSGVNFGERGLHPAFWGSPFFRQLQLPSGAGVAVTNGGEQSWFCLDSGWESFRSVNAEVFGSSVSITAVDFNGNVFAGTVPTSNSNVRVTSNNLGTFVQLTGASSSYNLQQVANAEPAAVDAAFAE